MPDKFVDVIQAFAFIGEISSQRPWKFKLLRSKKLGITACWDKRNRNYSKLRLKSEIPKTDHVVFAKHTCRMLDSFRLINSVNIFLSWISLSDKSWWAISYLFACICKDSLTEGSGFCSETIAFILNCICVYKPVYFRVYLFAFRLA